MQKKQILSSLLFQGLDAASSSRLLSLNRIVELKRQSLLFVAETPVDSLFFILNGKVKEYYVGMNGEEIVIQVCHPGGYLGFLSLFSNSQQYTSCAKAVTPLTVAVLNSKALLSQLNEDQEVNRNALRLLSHQLECAMRQRSFCQKMSAECRVATYLLNQADTPLLNACQACNRCNSCTINLTPINLSAQEVGLARETFTRVLSRFRQDGLIELNKGHLKLLDREAIEGLSQVV